MPEYNGSGPAGKGPMTGKGRGYCVLPINTPEEELNLLENREKTLQTELSAIQKRIGELKKLINRSKV